MLGKYFSSCWTLCKHLYYVYSKICSKRSRNITHFSFVGNLLKIKWISTRCYITEVTFVPFSSAVNRIFFSECPHIFSIKYAGTYAVKTNFISLYFIIIFFQWKHYMSHLHLTHLAVVCLMQKAINCG